MRDGNIKRLGLLMDQSHASLRDDFEVSNDALCAMVDIARQYAAETGNSPTVYACQAIDGAKVFEI